MKKIFLLFMLIALNSRVPAQPYQAGDHELLLMPTAYTMEKGKSYFSDYELIFLNFTMAPTSRTHISAFSMFPITKEFIESLSVGVKQNYLRRDKLQAAVWVTFSPRFELATLGNVISIGQPRHSFHFGLGVPFNIEDGSNVLGILLGYRRALGQKTTFIAEYTNAGNFEDAEFSGLFSIGIRFATETLAWDIGGIRPFDADADLLFFPLLKATFVF